jgi:FtsP/CotA-like multicopper oxidase with cupredoxin domain
MDHGRMQGMGRENMSSMDHGSMHGMSQHDMQGADHSQMSGMDHGQMQGMDHGTMQGKPSAGQARELPPAEPAPTRPGHGNSSPSVGRSLTYTDLRAAYPKPEFREPDREVLIRLTGNMERFIWSINDKKFSQAKPIKLKLGERVRFKFVNETMMNHPMHLHGMWMEPVNGQDAKSPRKHVVNIPPGQTYYVDVNVDAPGDWAFHCHLMYHMDAGMFRMITVAEAK